MGKKKDVRNERKNAIVQFLLENCVNGKPIRGKIAEATERFSVSRRTVSQLWAEAKKQQSQGKAITLVKGTRKRQREQVDVTLIENIAPSKPGTIRKLANMIKCSKTMVWRWIQCGEIRPHTSAIKPCLSAPNKLLRLQFALDSIIWDSLRKVLEFKTMSNTVHIDENWFYLTRGTHRFYLTPGEAEMHRTCQSKKFITKVRLMCAVSRPIIAPDGTVLFDGKIGIFPFTQSVPAKRSSKNRPAGTLETKAIDSITRNVVKGCLISWVIPAIKEKWPACLQRKIYIQQDNAKPHIQNDDVDFRLAASSDGFDIQLINQPPNFPDLNVNDLGWFRAIQSIQIESDCYNVDQLVTAVQSLFDALTAETLNNVFLSLQSCLAEVMKARGHNNYKISHMNKGRLIRRNELPNNVEVTPELIRGCVDYLNDLGNQDYAGLLINALSIYEQPNA